MYGLRSCCSTCTTYVVLQFVAQSQPSDLALLHMKPGRNEPRSLTEWSEDLSEGKYSSGPFSKTRLCGLHPVEALTSTFALDDKGWNALQWTPYRTAHSPAIIQDSLAATWLVHVVPQGPTDRRYLEVDTVSQSASPIRSNY